MSDIKVIKVFMAMLLIISLLAGCGGGGAGGGSGSGGGGSSSAGQTLTGSLQVATTVPEGTAGAENGVLENFSVNITTPAGSTITSTTDSNGGNSVSSVIPGNYTTIVYNPAYPSTVLLGLARVAPGRSTRDKTILNAATTAAALIGIRYSQTDSGRIAGMEIDVLNRIAQAGSNAKFNAVVDRITKYLKEHTVYFDVSNLTIIDSDLSSDVEAAKNSITVMIDCSPYFYQQGVTNPVALYARFNHDLSNVPPQNTTYTVTYYKEDTNQTVIMNSSNYSQYGSWDNSDNKIIRFALNINIDRPGQVVVFDWSYSAMPVPTDGTPLETDTAGKTNTHTFYMSL